MRNFIRRGLALCALAVWASPSAFGFSLCRVTEVSDARSATTIHRVSDHWEHPFNSGNGSLRLTLGDRWSRLKVYQYFDREAGSYLLYQIRCDRNLNCDGLKLFHTPQRRGMKKLAMAGMQSQTVASLGARPLFLFSRTPRGIHYEFLQGRKSPTETYGLEVTCE